MDWCVLRVCTLPFAFQWFSCCHTYFMVADTDVILQQDCDLLCLKGFKVRCGQHTDPAECPCCWTNKGLSSHLISLNFIEPNVLFILFVSYHTASCISYRLFRFILYHIILFYVLYCTVLYCTVSHDVVSDYIFRISIWTFCEVYVLKPGFSPVDFVQPFLQDCSE